jgi:hypothetical protein
MKHPPVTTRHSCLGEIIIFNEKMKLYFQDYNFFSFYVKRPPVTTRHSCLGEIIIFNEKMKLYFQDYNFFSFYVKRPQP